MKHIKNKFEKNCLKRKMLSTTALYDGQPRSKEELRKQAAEIVQRLVQGPPQTDMAPEILRLTSELKDADPMFNKLFLFNYPKELDEGPAEDFPRNFGKWAVEEGLAPAEEEEQLATEVENLEIISALVSVVCEDYHLLIPQKIVNESGEVYCTFRDADSADRTPLGVKIDQFRNEELQAIQPNSYGGVSMCLALIDDNNILDLIITTTKTLVPKQLPTPPSVIELAITAEPGNDCWTVYSHETQDFYEFHAKTQVQAAQVRQARSGDTSFTAHGFAYNPYTGYYEADYLDGID